MSKHLIDWLNETNYPIDNQRANNIDDNPLASIIAPLTSYSVIRVSGLDAEKFMQGQFSCDVREINGHQSRLGTANTPKGRAYAIFRIAKQGDDYLIRLPSEIAEDFCTRLNKYIVFSKATLSIDENYCVLGISGESKIVNRFLNTSSQLPCNVDDSSSINESIIIRVPSSSVPRYEIWCDLAHAKTLISSLQDKELGIEKTTQADWSWQEIREGVADIYSETQEDFVPQMLNLQHLNAISFKKGCYTGQEIIARMKYLGKLKKEMFLLSASPATDLPPGSDILVSQTGKKVGSVVRSMCSTDKESTILLAVLDIESAKSKLPLSLSEGSPQKFKYLTLPYTSSTDDKS